MRHLFLCGLSAAILLSACQSPLQGSPLASRWLHALGQLSLQQRTRSIAEVQQPAPGAAAVVLSGRVGRHVPLVDRWLYELTDASGSLWVLTSTPPPLPGTALEIEALIHYQPILVSGQDVGEHYAEEKKRL